MRVQIKYLVWLLQLLRLTRYSMSNVTRLLGGKVGALAALLDGKVMYGIRPSPSVYLNYFNAMILSA